MRDETRSVRQSQIEQAAYDILETKGYDKASMIAIARRAKASNETLYNWYGDKKGLFKALVARNAAEVKTLLEDAIIAEKDPRTTLELLGPRLLELLLGERAVGLNRAAAADPSGELGIAIAEAGRETVAPLIASVMSKARADGHLQFGDTTEAVELFLNLLIGDLQIRRVIGRAAAPGPDFVETRARTAVSRLFQLLG